MNAKQPCYLNFFNPLKKSSSQLMQYAIIIKQLNDILFILKKQERSKTQIHASTYQHVNSHLL